MGSSATGLTPRRGGAGTRRDAPLAGWRAAARGLPGAAGLLLLAACGGAARDPMAEITAPCPRVALLGEAADLTRYAGGGRDLSALVLDARLTGFTARCDYAPRNAGLDVTLRLAMSAERGQAAPGREATLPYLVAVVTPDETAVLAREAYGAQVAFPVNVNRVLTRGEEISIRLPGRDPQEAAQRTVLLGFVLTPEELALNRQRGPR